jgi:hypothetical protein
LQPQPQAGLTEAPEREVQVGLGGEQLLFDEGLLDGVIQEQTGEILKGDTKYNVLGQAEDVVASWTVGGVEIELPDWRPQPNQEYRIVDPSVSPLILCLVRYVNPSSALFSPVLCAVESLLAGCVRSDRSVAVVSGVTVYAPSVLLPSSDRC